MPAYGAKLKLRTKKKTHFKSKKKLASVLIQNDKILVIFQYFHRFQNYKRLLHSVQATRKFLFIVQIK